jgi:hypothetical protein
MSVPGQTEKNSVRAYVVRVTPESGHRTVGRVSPRAVFRVQRLVTDGHVSRHVATVPEAEVQPD